MPDLATALKKQAPTASLAVPSTCVSIWPLCIFTPSRFKTGWVISVCPLFFLIQGWWESCPSDYLCAAQELDVLRSAWFTAASTSPVLLSCFCLSPTSIFSLKWFFFLPAQHHFPAGDKCTHKHHWKGMQPDYSLIYSNWWATENTRFQDPRLDLCEISGLFHISCWNLSFCVRFLSFLPLEAPQSLTFFKCIWTNGRHCCVAWQPDHSNNLFLI